MTGNPNDPLKNKRGSIIFRFSMIFSKLNRTMKQRSIQDIHFKVKIKRVYRLSRDELLPRVRRRGGSFYRNDVDKSRKMISLERDGVSRGVGGFLRCSRNDLAVKHKSEGEGERASTRAVNEYIYKVTKLSKTRENTSTLRLVSCTRTSQFFFPPPGFDSRYRIEKPRRIH